MPVGEVLAFQKAWPLQVTLELLKHCSVMIVRFVE